MSCREELACTFRSIEETEAFPLLKKAIKEGNPQGINGAISMFMQEEPMLRQQIQQLLMHSNVQETDCYQVGETISENPLAILLACYIGGWEQVDSLFKDSGMLRLSMRAHGMNELGMKVYCDMPHACEPKAWAEASSGYDPEEDARWMYN